PATAFQIERPAETAPSTPVADEARALDEVQRRHIVEVLERTRGVIEGEGGAAKILRLHPNTLRSKMKKLGIRRATHEISYPAPPWPAASHEPRNIVGSILRKSLILIVLAKLCPWQSACNSEESC